MKTLFEEHCIFMHKRYTIKYLRYRLKCLKHAKEQLTNHKTMATRKINEWFDQYMRSEDRANCMTCYSIHDSIGHVLHRESPPVKMMESVRRFKKDVETRIEKLDAQPSKLPKWYQFSRKHAGMPNSETAKKLGEDMYLWNSIIVAYEAGYHVEIWYEELTQLKSKIHKIESRIEEVRKKIIETCLKGEELW